MTVGIVAPSSPVRTPGRVERGVTQLEQLGLRVVLGAHVHDTYGYLAGADGARADDLLRMLERDDVDAVLCLGGGYGAGRTVQALDLARLRRLRDRPAKSFVGYSDITVLHALLQHELGWTLQPNSCACWSRAWCKVQTLAEVYSLGQFRCSPPRNCTISSTVARALRPTPMIVAEANPVHSP